MRAIQLTLWAESESTYEYQCQHCGHRQNIMPDLRQSMARAIDQIMTHPSAARLHKPSKRFLGQVLPLLLTAETVGFTQIESEADLGRTGTRNQIIRLREAGILEAVPKRDGGVYHVYRLAVNGYRN